LAKNGNRKYTENTKEYSTPIVGGRLRPLRCLPQQFTTTNTLEMYTLAAERRQRRYCQRHVIHETGST